MIPLLKITGEENSERQIKYNRRIPLSKIIGDASPEKKSEDNVSIWDMALKSAQNALRATPLGIADLLLPDGITALAGGTGAEIIGNALQTLGDPDKTLAARYNPTIGNAMRSGGNFMQDIADKALDYGQQQIQPGNFEDYTGSARNAYDSGFYNVYSGLASMLHADKSSNA